MWDYYVATENLYVDVKTDLTSDKFNVASEVLFDADSNWLIK